MEIELTRYNPSLQYEWDTFVEGSRNGLFFFKRGFMDYHSDRFSDHSLIFKRKNNVVAVFPANETGTEIHSHSGLTYGSLVIERRAKSIEVLEIFCALKNYYKLHGFNKIIYKTIPYIFSKIPFQEDLYALFLNNAQLFRRDISSVISIRDRIPLAKSPTKKIKDCSLLNLQIKESTKFENYWSLLTEVLARHDAKPVHSLQEIERLFNGFPDNIKLFEVFENEDLICGTVLFDFGNVVHTQYLANSTRGRDIGALDYLLINLIENRFPDRDFFSFGISTEKQGRFLNEGLINQKEMYGGRAVCNEFYEIILK